ncbi:alcohol dehydrogenase Adh1-like [Schizosaccharomyces osmophilus]|uniref:Alcohol dehydrogenase Adh1-like n=1 Tax=Schizosaccharomyces osmophilus TaxID=2545709 RepID=A0AAE9WG37_9SCHI|nr:alcohol dehydrogenase Adh1-like [Schizosaccharomyces osmophilus]WBW75629.1 alcohol dehydrogenase Adh1-like [Schizosaccharomyces osmophilus]
MIQNTFGKKVLKVIDNKIALKWYPLTKGNPKSTNLLFFNNHGGPEQTHFEEVPVPEPASDEVLVNIKYSGVCHTDLHALQGDWPLDVILPVVGGHEGTGI